MALTLEQCMTMVRRRLGWPTADTFVADAEIFEMLRQSQRELNDLLISIHQGDWRLVTTTFPTVAGQNAYAISTLDPTADLTLDISRVRRLSARIDGKSVPMRRWNVETDFIDTTQVAWDSTTDIKYRWTIISPNQGEFGITGVYVYPTPSNVVDIEIWVNAGIGTFSATDAINILGNEEYLVLDGMIKCLIAEETDASQVMAQKEALMQRMIANQSPVDAGQAQVIQDVRGADIDRRWGWWR